MCQEIRGGNMKRTMRICSIALIIYFLWTEVWINLFMRRLYTICQWGYNNVIYKIFLYSHSIDTYLRIILEGVILYCGLKMIKEIMHKIDNL